jgi:hypothetical protein
MSASGAVASIAFHPCPTHFLMTHKTASLSHSSRTSSLRAADCNTNTTPPTPACSNSCFPPLCRLVHICLPLHPGIYSTLTPSSHLCTTHLRQMLLIEHACQRKIACQKTAPFPAASTAPWPLTWPRPRGGDDGGVGGGGGGRGRGFRGGGGGGRRRRGFRGVVPLLSRGGVRGK